MKIKRLYNANTTFNDLLFNALLAFVALFIVSFCLMSVNQKKQDKNVDARAEFMITMTWPKECEDDVDLYVQDPNDKVVFFRAREDGLMHLDRDDLGHSNDVTVLPDGRTIRYDYNIETVTIRGLIAGEYTVNAHMYAKRGPQSVPVTIKIEKLNPYVQLIDNRTIMLETNGDEKTFARFRINEKGIVLNIDSTQKDIANSRTPRGDEYDGGPSYDRLSPDEERPTPPRIQYPDEEGYPED